MTTTQIEVCKTCLNRKKGDFEPTDICNIRGMVLQPEEVCGYYDHDKTIVTDKEKIEDLVRPNSERAKWAIILVGAVMLMNVISIFSSYLQLGVLQQLKAGALITDADIEGNDNREQLVGILFSVVFIVSAVFFIQWFRRAYYNLHVRTGNCNETEGWAAGAWFVPIVCIYKPYRMMLELWNKTTDLVVEKTKTNWSSSARLVSFWWALWITSNFIGKLLLKRAFDNEDVTIDKLIDSTQFSILDSSFSIVLGMVTILMIREYSKREKVLNG